MESSKDNVISFRRGDSAPICKVPLFNDPHHIVRDTRLTLEEKRAILANWASDAHAVRSQPTLRCLPGISVPVTLASIMEARSKLDMTGDRDDDDDPPPTPRSMRSCSEPRPLRQAA